MEVEEERKEEEEEEEEEKEVKGMNYNLVVPSFSKINPTYMDQINQDGYLAKKGSLFLEL